MILFLVTILAAALWQPALIALVAWAALRLSRCSNATTRHIVWLLALLASVAVPIVSALPVLQSTIHTTSLATPHTLPAQPLRLHLLSGGAIQPAHANAVPPAMARPHMSLHPTAALVIAAVWLLAMLAILARLCSSFFYLERLKRDALPLSVEARQALSRWERAEKGHRDVRICVSDEIAVPVAVGIFDAMILLPSDFMHELDAHDIDRVLLHELAHIRRSDDWVNLVERVVHALFFFSPGIYWISRQLDLEREVACDDWVLELSTENVPYARCLARIVEMTQWPHDPVAAPGVFVTRKSMSIRIERLLARSRDIRIRIAPLPSLLAVVALLAIMVGGGFLSPTIAYTIDTVASNPIHVTPPNHLPIDIAALTTGRLEATTAPAELTHDSTSSDSYLDELAHAGLQNLSADKIIELKSLGINSEYIRSMRRYFDKLTPDDLSALKWLGINQEYLDGLRSQGFVRLSAHDVCALKTLGIDADYIKSLAAAGYPHLTVNEYSQLKAVGVTANYIHALRAHGLTNLTVDRLTEFKTLGIAP
jgi:beta-lactamase regulating signal transducer with metallopeptidase domain